MTMRQILCCKKTQKLIGATYRMISIQGTFDVYRNNSLELATSGISILNVWLVSGISTESIFFFCNVKGRHQCFF
jgi:hypothetical protein